VCVPAQRVVMRQQADGNDGLGLAGLLVERLAKLLALAGLLNESKALRVCGGLRLRICITLPIAALTVLRARRCRCDCGVSCA
jgi:hypothetical protein